MDQYIPKVLFHPTKTTGLAFWRLLWPAYQLSVRREITYSTLRHFPLDALPYVEADTVVIQRCGGKMQAEYLKKVASLRAKANFRLVYDIDDVIFYKDVPDYHVSKKRDDYSEESYTRELMQLCDEMTVSTPYLKEYYEKELSHNHVTVVPNKIPFFWAGNCYSEQLIRRNYRKHKAKPRIIYAGSGSHTDMTGDAKDDFSAVLKVIEATRKEFQWVFVGTCPLAFKKYVENREMDLWNWVPLGELPKLISNLEGNMMIAPLVDNVFNRAKSDIKYLEACAHGLPIACQDITPYKDAPIRFNSGDEMIAKIRAVLGNEEAYFEASRRAKAYVDQNWLEVEKNIMPYREVYSFDTLDQRRTYR